MDEMETCIGIKIPGLGMREPGTAIPGVKEPDIETPGEEDLYVDLDLE